jgi:hypothetical protein
MESVSRSAIEALDILLTQQCELRRERTKKRRCKLARESSRAIAEVTNLGQNIRSGQNLLNSPITARSKS